MKISLTQACVILIGFIFVGKLYAVLFYGADFALFITDYNNVFCHAPLWHCWTFQTSIPYSVVWVWMNPLWLGRFWYGVYIIIFDAITTILWWQIKRIPKLYLACMQILSIGFYLFQGAEYQNVSIMVFYPLMFFALKTGKIVYKRLIPLALIPILIKLPLGWAIPWDLSNPHVVCIWACSGVIQQHLSIIQRLMAVITNYGILIGSWLITIRVIRRITKTKPL